MSIKARKWICYAFVLLFFGYFSTIAAFYILQTTAAYRVWEFMIFISGPLEMLFIVSTIDDVKHNTYWVLAIVFGSVSMLTTMLAHFENLLLNQGEPGFITIDYLSWGILFGLECIFASLSFSKEDNRKGIKNSLLAMGILCLAGLSGPLTHIDALWFTAVMGFGPVAVIPCIFQLRYLKGLIQK